MAKQQSPQARLGQKGLSDHLVTEKLSLYFQIRLDPGTQTFLRGWGEGLVSKALFMQTYHLEPTEQQAWLHTPVIPAPVRDPASKS